MPVITFNEVESKSPSMKKNIISFDDIETKPLSSAPQNVLTFDNVPNQESKIPNTSKNVVTFEEVSKPEQPSQNEIQELKDKFGTIGKAPGLKEQLISSVKRKGALGLKAFIGDIPYVRKLISDESQIAKTQPVTNVEIGEYALGRLVRDIGLYTGGSAAVEAIGAIPKIAKAVQIISKIPKVGGLIAKVITEAPKGAILGALTAESEEPIKIAEKAGVYGAFTGGVPIAMKGLGMAGQGVAKITPEFIKKAFVNFGKSIGMVLENNKAVNLIRGRQADLMTGQIESEQFIQGLNKILTPDERKLIPFIRERALTKEARQQILRNPEIRARYNMVLKPAAQKIGEYLDDAHKFLMENYGDDIGFIQNYIPHMWDVPKNKEKAVVRWFVTRNPHLKERLVPTLKEGIEKFGLKPKYEDISDILRVYDQYKIKAIANVKFAKALVDIKDISGIKMIQRVDKAPSDWPTLDHPALRKALGRYVGEGEEKTLMLNKIPVKVHPEIYESVKAVFDNPLSNEALRGIQQINAAAKYANLSLSLFHHTALTETGIATPGMIPDTIKAWNPIKIIKAFKTGTYKTVFNDIELSKDAAAHGLELGMISDVEGGNVLIKSLYEAERNLRNIRGNLLKRGVAKIGILATKIRKPLEFNNKFLWDYLHSSFKLSAYEKLTADMIKKHPELPIGAVKKEMAQFVNDTYGGQVWELLAKSPKWKQFAHFVMLSPDWTLSTLRQAMSPFGVGAVDPLTRGLRAELGQDFWRRAIVYFGGAVNNLNYTLTKAYTGKGRFMWENAPGKKTHLFIGYNPDGTEAYLRWGKQFRELAEFINNPVEVASRKMSPLGRQLKAQLFPHPVWQKEFADKPFWNTEALIGRAKEIGKGFAPYSITQQAQRGFNPLAFAMPISKGMTPYRARDLFKSAIKRKDIKALKEIYSSALNNNLDAATLFKQARTSIKSDITFDFKKEAKKIIERLQKLGREKGMLELKRMKETGELTPELEKQLIKILEQQQSIKRQREGLGLKIR